MTTTARTEANRENAKLSTGPRTAAGKERSRLNGLKHGLRSEEAVLPTESRAEFDDHMADWDGDWRPGSVTRRLFVERAALAAWRLKRCVRVETERLSDRANKALNEWDEGHRDRRDRLVAGIVRAPFDSVYELEQTRTGIDRLIGLWDGLLDSARDRDGWDDPESHHLFFIMLRSADPDLDDEEDAAVEVASWRLLMTSRPDLAAAQASEGEDSRPYDTITASMVRLQIAKMGQVRLDRLRRLRATLPDDAVARARFAESEAYLPRREDASFQRYEARHDREARAAVATLIALHKSGADVHDEPIEPIAPTEPRPEAVAIAPLATAPTEPKPAPPAKASTESKPEPVVAATVSKAPTEPNALGGNPPDRDRGGRSWPVSEGIEAPNPARPRRSDQ
jgi:hypothetical protein